MSFLHSMLLRFLATFFQLSVEESTVVVVGEEIAADDAADDDDDR